MADTLGIMDALKYSLKRKKGLLNAYWLLIPIIGWAIYYGYYMDIVDEFKKKKREELPVLGGIGETLKNGFMFLVFFIVMALVINVITAVLSKVSISIGALASLFFSFVIFVEVGLYIRKRDYHDTLDFNLVFELVKKNFVTMIVLWIKSVAIAILCSIGSMLIITIPVLVPVAIFATSALAADFYVNMYGQIEKESKKSK